MLIERLVNAVEVVRMVMSIVPFQRFYGHAKVSGRLPEIRCALHEPRRRGVPESMDHDLRIEARQAHGIPERACVDGLHRLTAELHDILVAQPLPSSDVR